MATSRSPIPSTADADNGKPDPDTVIEKQVLAELQGMSLAEVMIAGHEALLRLLVAKSMAGTISHQEQSVLRNLLRDNGMIMPVSPFKTIDAQPQLPPMEDLPLLEAPDYLEDND